jgi:UDP-N-acetyl-D-glucosamine dehydrogenase
MAVNGGSSPMDMKETLLAKIADRKAVIGVVGLGYVGLPLALEFARAGFKVIGYDVSKRVVDQLNKGVSHIQDVASTDLADVVKRGLFQASSDAARIAEMDAVSIAVPTPLVKTRDPDMSYVVKATETIAAHAHPGMLVVLEGTRRIRPKWWVALPPHVPKWQLRCMLAASIRSFRSPRRRQLS